MPFHIQVVSYLKKKVLQEFYLEFLLKLHNRRISLAKLSKLVDKLCGWSRLCQLKYGNLEITINMIKNCCRNKQ